MGVKGIERSGRPTSSSVPSQAGIWGGDTHVYPWHRLINKSARVLNPMEKGKSSPVKKKKKKERNLEFFVAQSVYTPLSTLINPWEGRDSHTSPGTAA